MKEKKKLSEVLTMTWTVMFSVLGLSLVLLAITAIVKTIIKIIGG